MKRLLIALFICTAPAGMICAKKKKCSVTRITADDIFPFTIIKSGRYILCDDITFDGVGTAITIDADNVQLFLNAHSIFLTDEDATGIKIDGHKEILIANDAIANTEGTSGGAIGIHIKDAQKVSLQKLCTIKHQTGLKIENSCDVFVDTCSFIEAEEFGVQVSDSSLVTFKSSTFNDSKTNVKIDGASKDVKILTCSFPNVTEKNLEVNEINGLLIKNSTFCVEGDAFTGGMVTFGVAPTDDQNPTPGTKANNIRIECSTFVNSREDPFVLHYLHGFGLKIDSCLFEGGDRGFLLRLLSFGPDTSNVHVRGCTLNEAASGIVINGTCTVIEDCLVQNCITGVIFGSTSSSCAVLKSTICDNEIGGIQLGGFSHVVSDSLICNASDAEGLELFDETVDNNAVPTLHVIKNNTVVDNKDNGIVVEGNSNSIINNEVLGNGENGIELKAGADDNTVQHNRVHNNSTKGIDNAGTANQIYFNTAHDNGASAADNYTGGGVVNSPNTARLEASNISQ